jgi:Mor family transcriptional regulator
LSTVLPVSVRLLAKIVGLPQVLKILAWSDREGIFKVYIPKKKPSMKQHVLIGLLGGEEIGKLVELYGGSYLRFPRCSSYRKGIRNAYIYKQVSSGRSVGDVAVEVGLSQKRVAEIVSSSNERTLSSSEMGNFKWFPSSGKKKEMVLKMKEQRCSIREIMHATGLSKSGVYKCLGSTIQRK